MNDISHDNFRTYANWLLGSNNSGNIHADRAYFIRCYSTDDDKAYVPRVLLDNLPNKTISFEQLVSSKNLLHLKTDNVTNAYNYKSFLSRLGDHIDDKAGLVIKLNATEYFLEYKILFDSVWQPLIIPVSLVVRTPKPRGKVTNWKILNTEMFCDYKVFTHEKHSVILSLLRKSTIPYLCRDASNALRITDLSTFYQIPSFPQTTTVSDDAANRALNNLTNFLNIL